MLGNIKLFLIISFLIVAVLAGFAGVALRDMGTQSTVHMVESDNARLAKVYGTNVWKSFQPAVLPIVTNDPSKLKDDPQVRQFAQETVRYFMGTPLIRANIYSATGMLMIALDVDQSRKLGQSGSPDAEFLRENMRAGGVVSKVVRGAVGGQEASIVQTIVPVKNETSGATELVLELMYDVTEPVAQQVEFQIIGTVGVVALFLLFVVMMVLSSRRSESIIARQHEANMELAAAAATAQAENREKSQFLANISHELRTPLNAIIGFSDIIKNEVMPNVENQKYKDYISDINSSGVHLLSLINDILDYSKAEAGKLEMEVSEVNATKLIQNSMRLVAPRAETAKVKLTEAMPKEQLIMITDSKKFKQILLNLLSNAVKFTPAGGEIRITAWRDLAEDTVSFEVRDSGIGIAPKDLARAMAPFGQVDSALSRKYEGTGLGLPLTKKFVELMGGKFNIESEVGKGTNVTFTLPRELTAREGVIIKQTA